MSEPQSIAASSSTPAPEGAAGEPQLRASPDEMVRSFVQLMQPSDGAPARDQRAAPRWPCCSLRKSTGGCVYVTPRQSDEARSARRCGSASRRPMQEPLQFGGDDDDILLSLQQLRLSKKKELNLSSRTLEEIPEEVRSLQGLRKLSLHHNRLSSLPANFGGLTSLRTLTLYTNHLRQIPPEIGRLQFLQQLYLSHNELTSLPIEITRLTALQELALNSNRLGHFPPQLSDMPSLRQLYLSNNQIRELPSTIGNLSLLERLYLDSNELRRLPVEIGSLVALKRLYLYKNHLVSLPSEIGGLSVLKRLYLHNNRLAGLPATIDSLQNLQLLDLFNNPFAWTEEGKIKRKAFPSLRDLSATALMQLVEDDSSLLELIAAHLPRDLLLYLRQNHHRCDGPWCRRPYYGDGVVKTVRKDWRGLSFPVVEVYCTFACVLLRGTKQAERRKVKLRKPPKLAKKPPSRPSSPPLSTSPPDERLQVQLELHALSTSPPRTFGGWSPPGNRRGYLSS